MAEIDYYKVLQLDPEAEPEIVRAVYWRLSQKYHPDGSNPDPVKMRQINDAHEVIGDPARRKRYNSHRQYGWDSVSNTDSTRSPSYWKPTETFYNPDARRARKKYRSPSIPAPVGIFGGLALVAFLAIVLESGFGFVQRAASSVATTPTPAPVERWFETRVVDLRSILTDQGFTFDTEVSASAVTTSANEDFQAQVFIENRIGYVESVTISFDQQGDMDELELTPQQLGLIMTVLAGIGTPDEASNFLVNGVELWTVHRTEDALLQSGGVTIKPGTDSELHTVTVRFSPAP